MRLELKTGNRQLMNYRNSKASYSNSECSIRLVGLYPVQVWREGEIQLLIALLNIFSSL